MIEVVGSTAVYANPRPELRARHAWHPSLISLGRGAWLCTFDIGQAPESHDYVTYVSRSVDDGAEWSPPMPMLPAEPAPRATHSVRVGRMLDGTLLGVGARFVRDDPDQGLINHPGIGYCDVELIRTSSTDGGHTWAAPVVLEPPVRSPAFETCHAPVALSDGRVLYPTSTWLGWDETGDEGMRALCLMSTDGGRTWPAYLDEFDRWRDGIVSWEQSVAELGDGRLVAVVWSLELASGVTLPTRYAVTDRTAAFGAARETGIVAQTMKLGALGGNRIIAVYRRHDRPGLWASTAQIGDSWQTEQSHPVWSGAGSGMPGRRDAGSELSALEFGCPSVVVESPDRVAIAFWCRKDGLYGIRMLRLRLTPG